MPDPATPSDAAKSSGTAAGKREDLAPSVRATRSTLRAGRLALPIGTAFLVAAGFAGGRATAPDDPAWMTDCTTSCAAPPMIAAEPAEPAEPAQLSPSAIDEALMNGWPLPAAPAPAAAPSPSPAAPSPSPAAPSCDSADDEDTPPAQWTMSDEHLGPFTRCMAELDLAYVKGVLPGFNVTAEPAPYFPDHHYFKVTRRGQPFLSIWPASKDGGPGLRIEIHAPEIETPWRVKVGDRLGTLSAHHRGIECLYGAAEGDENLWCRRAAVSRDGWRDTLLYSIDMRPLGQDRSYLQGEIDPARLAHLRIEKITWSPATAAN